jgi:Uma2 family endonuclease
MGATKTLLTAQEFDTFPFEEDKRYELDEGEMLEMTRPAYKHNRIMGALYYALTSYFNKRGNGEALLSENLYALSPTVRRSPDVSVILGNHHAELADAKIITLIPDIAVEILSPSESLAQIHRKLKQYFQAGVKEVWLIDPATREAEIWTGPSLPERVLTEADALESLLLPEFSLTLAALFS